MFFLSSSPNDSKINLARDGSSIATQLMSCVFDSSNVTTFSRNCLSNPSAPSPKNSLNTVSNLVKSPIACVRFMPYFSKSLSSTFCNVFFA